MSDKTSQIEETLAHQEQQITDLSDMVIAQGHAIDKLKQHIEKLEGKIEDMGEDAAPADQKPPHY